MEFRYLDGLREHPLIDHFYILKITESDLPFTSLIVPIGHTNVTYIFSEKNQFYDLGDTTLALKDLILTGQITGHYQFRVLSESENLGFAFKPTSLYKVLDMDVSKFSETHTSISKISSFLSEKFEAIFKNFKDDETKLVEEIYNFLDGLNLSEDKNLPYIDKAIAIILKKEGLLTVQNLLDELPLGQKTLETQFKKIVGTTPGKYIKKHRFITLMKQYQSKEIDIETLLYRYNYYDKSHFNKDFKYYMGENPKSYFQKDFPLIEKYLIE